MTSPLALEYAERRVGDYDARSRDVLARHADAMDCRDCEAFLQLGVDAFNWLMRADRAIRSAYSDGSLAFDKNLESSLRGLCEAWLVSSSRAEEWTAKQVERGYEIDNLAEFRRCGDEMRAIVDYNRASTNEEIPAAIARLRDEALDEHANGQTAEFV